MSRYFLKTGPFQNIYPKLPVQLPCLCVYDISKARNRQAAGARCNKTVTLRRLCYRGPLRGAGAPQKEGPSLYIIMRRRRVVRGGATWGRELRAGAFSVSPQGRAFARPPLAYPVGGTGKEDPSSVTAFAATPSPTGEGFGAAGSLREILGLCAGVGLAPPVSGMFCDWYGGRRTPHPPRLAPPHLPPTGEGFWGGWKPAGDFGPLRRGGACPRLSLACSVTGTGGGGPSSAAARAATPSPTGGRLWAGHGVLMDHERKRPDLLRVRPLFSFSNR